MAEFKAGPRKREPTHPGRIVGSSLEALRMSARAAAERMGISNTALSNIIAGKAAVTVDIALRLDALFGNGAEIWLGLQNDYDLWHARIRLKAELAAIERVKDA